MAASAQLLDLVLDYARRIAEKRYDIEGSQEAQPNELFITIQELQDQLNHEEEEIAKLKQQLGREALEEPTEPLAQLQQLHLTKVAYTRLLEETPSLPPAHSPLPALLALRASKSLVSETKESIAVVYEELKGADVRLASEEANLRDTQAMATALTTRNASLQVELDQQAHKSPDETATEMIEEQQKLQAAADKETKRLIKALTRFVNGDLAGMLAAEELGGPVVGDLVGITDEMLASGFSHLGKAKRPKTSPGASDNRQQRIDHIWGQQAGHDTHNTRNERQAAAREMRSLVEELLNLAVEQGTGSYVTLQRESAAARFLVRARVAQFHPKDAKKLRLIDFGRELDD